MKCDLLRKVRRLFGEKKQPVNCFRVESLLETFDCNTGQETPDVLILGDSVSLRVSRDDNDKRDLIQNLGDKLSKAGLDLASIAGSAYHSGVFEALVKALVSMSSLPKVVIYPVNMRSYSPQWFLNPKWQFDDIIGEADDYLKKRNGLRNIRQSEVIDQRSYEDFRVDFPIVPISTIRDLKEWVEKKPATEAEYRERYKIIFICNYLYKFSEENIRLRSTVNIFSTLFEAGIKVICYITPVNHEAAERFVGPIFQELFNKNVIKLKNTLNAYLGDEKRVSFFDWTKNFNSTYFFHENFPVEHLNELGRHELSSMLYENVVQMLKESLN